MRGTEGQDKVLRLLIRNRREDELRLGVGQKRGKPGRLGPRQFLRAADQLGAEAHVQRELRCLNRLLAQCAQVDRQGPSLDAGLIKIQREVEDLGRRSRCAQRLEPSVKAQPVFGQDKRGRAIGRFAV